MGRTTGPASAQLGHRHGWRASRTRIDARWGNTDDIEGADRWKSCIPYLLPLLDGEIFGKYIYERVPPLGFLDALFIGPLHESFARIPFAGLIFFVALTLGTRLNWDMNRNLRFNAQQAALIDVALSFPEFIGAGFEGEDVPRNLVEPCMNFVWYCYMSMVLYCIYSNVVQKKKPDKIPWISGFAETMTGPI
jgi:Chloroplast import apparatus Tic20-like